ncbi:glutamate-tRNA ligase [Cavenderia fasciculata]|uniref:glutamate--tRNA ligase n=1 Tax=Cavenderia fasciculata TaxID=261658 RepID=F4PK87_CACFS|nr:glutamate-tRNA ligase [Cavenderia fasciculata]EGG24011.1 glutamate-tRNA ligase [Cavenderia fasciculata]|eukprot:XP_004361862.1 glutamate-tRNA ligase [Cavenderia fasciculata]
MILIRKSAMNLTTAGSSTSRLLVSSLFKHAIATSSSSSSPPNNRYYCSNADSNNTTATTTNTNPTTSCNHQHSHSKKIGDHVRVRYAPSPTGSLHLGGLRTALYNYLFARKEGGTFILRIEDTDRTRFVEGSAKNLENCLEWAGIPYDEGPARPRIEFAPYVQSERLPLYKQHADELVKKGSAYYCFCTSERLEVLKANTMGKQSVSIYDRNCLRLSKEEIEKRLANGMSHTIRLKIPHTTPFTKFNDIVKGSVQFANSMIDDQILLKSDGFPTYHLASVVDDHHMKITHIIRGEEWISSTPKHVILYEAFGWTPPTFAHVPLLLNKDKSKLSKRQGDVSVDAYINKGYLPEALVNFVAFLGWAPSETTKEVFTLKELINSFSLEGINKSGSVVDLDKLDWLNVQHIRLQIDNGGPGMMDIVKQVKENLKRDLAIDSEEDEKFLIDAIKCVKDRIHKVIDFNQLLKPFYLEPDLTTEEAIKMKAKVWNKDNVTVGVPLFLKKLAAIDNAEFKTDTIYSTLQNTVREMNQSQQLTDKELSTKTNQLMSVIRYILLGAPTGGGIPATIAILGKDKTINRINSNLNSSI